MRIVKTAILLLLVFSIALLTVRFFFLDQTADFILQKIGADDIRVHGLKIDFQQVHVDELAAAFKLQGGERVQVEIHNISFQYDLQQLVTTGKGKQVDIEDMGVSLTGISCFLQSKNPHFCKQKSSVEGGEFLTI
jgi:hypothetical protein